MFKSINYSRIVCEKCNAETIIEPGYPFKGLNCECKEEASRPYQDITVWTNGEDEVEVLGEFDNGDFEIKYTDGTRSYRLPHQTFIDNYEEVTREDIPPPLEALTAKELKELAKEQGITGVAKMNKETLIERLTDGTD